MDMDDDFIGEIEFNLSPEQADLVSRAISVASRTRDDDGFVQINPLIAIMSWWKANAPESQARVRRRRHSLRPAADFSSPTRRRNRGRVGPAACGIFSRGAGFS